MGDDLFKDGKVISSFSEAELILNVHDRLVKLVKDAKEDGTEFDTDWQKEACDVLALLQQEEKMKKPDWKKAHVNATHWDAECDIFCNIEGWWDSRGQFIKLPQKRWGTSRYLSRPAKDGLQHRSKTMSKWKNLTILEIESIGDSDVYTESEVEGESFLEIDYKKYALAIQEALKVKNEAPQQL